MKGSVCSDWPGCWMGCLEETETYYYLCFYKMNGKSGLYDSNIIQDKSACLV